MAKFDNYQLYIIEIKEKIHSVMTNQEDPHLANFYKESLIRRAENSSETLLHQLSEVYANELFMAEHPDCKNRFDVEKDKLCWLIHLRLNEEQARDTLLEAIGRNPENESLYLTLQNVHNHILEIQQKIEEEISSIHKLTKSCMRQYRMDGWHLQWKRSIAKTRMKTQQLGNKMSGTVAEFRYKRRK